MCVIAVYTVSLRQQLQDVSKKLVGALHYNKDGSVNNRQESLPVVTSLLCHYSSGSCLFFVRVCLRVFVCTSASVLSMRQAWAVYLLDLCSRQFSATVD